MSSGIPPIPTEEIERLLASSAIQRHAAIVHLENDFIYSGVYAKSFGYEGILIAGHCAGDFLAAKHIALSVSELMHQLWVESNAFEHVPIGYDEAEGYTSNGPDLSFVIIRDDKLLRAVNQQDRVLRRHLKPDLLIIDDMGLKALPKHSGEYLLEVVLRRYENRSTLMTSNRPIQDWGKLLGDVPAASAILDRFLHHAHTIAMTGRSYRLKDQTSAKEQQPPKPTTEDHSHD